MSSHRTDSAQYAERLVSLERAWWRRLLPVQAPYRWNLRRHRLGRTLDVGCGVGRNLAHLDPGSVGVDHNATSVREARERGLPARTVQEWLAGDEAAPASFDSILLAHVLEHLAPAEARALLADYLGYLRPGGRVLMICPQERGYATDATHRTYLTGPDLVALAQEVGLRSHRWRSFPFPPAAGRFFAYNEFVVVAELPEAATVG